MTAAAHPFSYCKVLIQLGHEPLPPMIRRNIFFRKQLQYPNVLQYMKHIKARDGTVGLFRGLPPRICANISASITYMAMAEVVGFTEKRETPDQGEDLKTAMKRMSDMTSREITAKCVAIVVSHPFHVIAIRSMAQFIGRETYYSGVLSAVKEIYNEEGLMGFFAGLMPRLAAEFIQIWLCNLLCHALNVYVLNDQSDLGDLRQYSQAVTNYIASVVTYPINLTSTVMAVSGSRLAAGNPPHMDVYAGWLNCLKDLRKRGLANRGSSLFFRRAIGYAINSTSVTPMPPIPK